MLITLSCRSDGASHEHDGRGQEAPERIYGMVTEDGESLVPLQRVKIYPSDNVPLPKWTFPTAAGSEREDKAFFGWESLHGMLHCLVLADGPVLMTEYVR